MTLEMHIQNSQRDKPLWPGAVGRTCEYCAWRRLVLWALCTHDELEEAWDGLCGLAARIAIVMPARAFSSFLVDGGSKRGRRRRPPPAAQAPGGKVLREVDEAFAGLICITNPNITGRAWSVRGSWHPEIRGPAPGKMGKGLVAVSNTRAIRVKIKLCIAPCDRGRGDWQWNPAGPRASRSGRDDLRPVETACQDGRCGLDGNSARWMGE